VRRENSKREVLRFVREVLLEVASPPPLDEDAVKAYQARVKRDNSRRARFFLAKKKDWRITDVTGYERFIPERTLDLMLNLRESLQRRLYDADRKKTIGSFSFEIEEFIEASERRKVVDPFLVLSVRKYQYDQAEVRLYVDYWNETEFVPVYREV